MSIRSSRGRSFTFAILLFLLSVPFLAVSHASGDTEKGSTLATVTRMLGFEPHPSTIDVTGHLILQGKPVTATIELLETWDSGRAVPAIRKLGFRLRLFSNGAEMEVVELPAQPIDSKKLKKGSVLASGTGKAVGLKVTTLESTGKGKNISALTLDFALTSTGEELQQAAEPSAAAATDAAAAPSAVTAPAGDGATVVRMARTLAARADAMPAAAVSGKVLLYRKALSALPTELDSTDIALLRAEINGKLEALQPSAAPAAQSISSSAPEANTTATAPSLSSPVMRERHEPSAEVKSLFENAQKAFDRQEEPAARDFLRQATEKDPAYFEAWLLLGKNAVGNSKYARAKEALEKALSLRPDDAEAGALHFKACYYLGEGETGIEKLFGMVSRKPDVLASRMALADAYYQVGDLPLCEEQCLAILDRFPGNDRARDLLVKTRERMK